MSTTTTTRRKITLTGRQPVSIVEDEWPVIAQAVTEDYDGQIRAQSTRTTDASIRVRRHADGRALVYAVHDYDTQWQHERGYVVRHGRLLDADVQDADIADCIRAVASDMSRDVGEDAVVSWSALGRGCIADLPAEML